LHQALQLPCSARLIATIGQIGLRKGQDVLAAAAPQILRRAPEVHFLVIGERSSAKAESIEFEHSILRQFETRQISAHLHRLGYRDDVAEILREIDLVVHPANQEPFGRVLLEAAACGVPVVATDVGGTREIVHDGITGRLVPPRDASSLAEAVCDLLTSYNQLQSMRRAARERAVNEFDVAQSAAQLLQHWRSVPWAFEP
jgi:glycosyltransferase involved in cell wall biosynthesis